MTKILLGDLDISKFKPMSLNEDPVLYDPENDLLIDELVYAKIAGFIRKLHGISYKRIKAKGKLTKQAIINKEKAEMDRRANEPHQSQLKNLVSSMLVYPGFKYKAQELKDCGIYEFMDSVQRAQIFMATEALTKGAYSGFMDTSKINKEEFNWMREIK